jgi:hypothetical protein
MEYFPYYGASIFQNYCAYCGSQKESGDHVPSQILLDEPYPDHLPIVPACKKCNQGFSLDEEYLACLLDCMITGNVDVNEEKRLKVRKAINHSPKLKQMLNDSKEFLLDGSISIVPDWERVEKVVLKLARGHSLYELNEYHIESPSRIFMRPIPLMAPQDMEKFMALPISSRFAEVGSRHLERTVIFNEKPYIPEWIIVQPERYMFAVSVSNNTTIRLIIRNYLACEVCW